MKYVVGIREVWVNYITVEADSIGEAICLVEEGEGEEPESIEYSHQMDSSLWSVEDEEGNLVF